MSSPSPSPSRMSKLRRTQDTNNSLTNTITSSSNSDDATLETVRTPPTDGSTSKFKDVFRRKSVDVNGRALPVSPDSGRRLSRIRLGRKNKLKQTTSNDLSRHLSVDSENGNLELSGNRSESSLLVDLDGSGGDSILTDDGSENEGKPVRPPLSTHPSHTGYLTLSAPEINSQTVPVTTEPESIPSLEIQPTSQSTTNIPNILEPYDIEPLEDTGRSLSTTDKFKSAFSLPRKSKSVDTGSVKSTGSGGVGSLFRPSSRSNSVEPDTVLVPASIEVTPPPEPEKTADSQSSGDYRPVTPQSSGRPRITIGNRPETPPNLVETPTTYVTPPTPTDPTADAPTFPRKVLQKSSPTSSRTTSPSRDSLKGRKTNPPSKLSQSIPAPLTPTGEEIKTPGGTLSQPANATGFFSSVFTAAQKAADSLSSSINTGITSSPKNKSVSSEPRNIEGGEEVIPGAESKADVEGGEKTQPAIETLGSGDLSLSHLGIAESGNASPMSSGTDLPLRNGSLSAEEEARKKAEEEAAARAVSEAYSTPVEKVISQAQGARPVSVASNDRSTLMGEPSPPRQSQGLDGGALERSASIRSKLSGQRKRRRRGTSGTAGTGNTTIVAGIAAAATGMGNLAANGTGKRTTGYAVANTKRNKDFHQLFRSVPEDDYLIEDYSAALQRDILLHGRLYVSEGHMCFSSNILGWVTNLVISFDEVVSVEKKSTAVIFPNALVISTLNSRNTFASFVARDSTYELIIGIWKVSHPNLKSSQNGMMLDNEATGDKTQLVEPEDSEGSDDTGSEDEIYDEDAEDDAVSMGEGGPARSIAGSEVERPTLSRQPSGTPVAATAPQTNGVSPPKGLEGADAVVAGAAVGADFPGPPTHDPTQCSDGAEHYDRPLIDATIPAPLGKVYSMVFGSASPTFMRKWHIEDQKSRELNLSEAFLDNEHKTLTFDYIKPLNAPVGPKQTKCITTYNLLAFDLEKAITVDCSTQTPDVPSGSVFQTKTRYCLMWGPSNSTRMVANCTIEWTGKSWLKGPIERGANDGQIEFVKSLVAALKAAVTTKPPVKGAPRKGKRRGKKEVYDAEEAIAQREAEAASEAKASDWGLFEPLHGPLKPFVALLGPFANSQVVIAVLFVLLMYTWINPPARKGTGMAFPGYAQPERLAAYEEMWRREENNLWDWLEDRVGLEGVYAPSLDGDKRERQRVLAARQMDEKVRDERMNERQMDSAIKVTEQRLSALKDAVARKKESRSKK